MGLSDCACFAVLSCSLPHCLPLHTLARKAGNVALLTSSLCPLTLSVSAGVIALVIFVIVCSVGVMSRFLYHKQSHRTSQMKKEYPENLDSAFRNEIDMHNTVNECKQEYFI